MTTGGTIRAGRNSERSILTAGQESWSWSYQPQAHLEYGLPVQLVTDHQATEIEEMLLVALMARSRRVAQPGQRYVYDALLEFYGEETMAIRRLRACLLFCVSLDFMRVASRLSEAHREARSTGPTATTHARAAMTEGSFLLSVGKN